MLEKYEWTIMLLLLLMLVLAITTFVNHEQEVISNYEKLTSNPKVISLNSVNVKIIVCKDYIRIAIRKK